MLEGKWFELFMVNMFTLLSQFWRCVIPICRLTCQCGTTRSVIRFDCCRYEDRAQFIKSIVKKLKQQQCFEDYAMHCMHPMELVTSPSHVSTRENTTSHISTSSSTPVPQVGVSPPSASVIHPQSRSPGMMTKTLSSDAHISPSNVLNTPEPGGRPRAHTYTYKKEAMEKINKKGM